jgi:hypothetical protein
MPSYATAASILSEMRDAYLTKADCYDANGRINPLRYLQMLMTDGDDELEAMAEDSLNNETDLHHGGATKEKKTREKRIHTT